MKRVSHRALLSTREYLAFIDALKARVGAAPLSAVRAVNRELVLLYWDIGRGILEKQKALGWGESVVEMIARDLPAAFSGTTGFSPQNVWRTPVIALIKMGRAAASGSAMVSFVLS